MGHVLAGCLTGFSCSLGQGKDKNKSVEFLDCCQVFAFTCVLRSPSYV